VNSEFQTAEQLAAETLIGLALAEDLHTAGDLTTTALVAESQQARVQVTARQVGILAGLPVAEAVFGKIDPSLCWETVLEDGSPLEPGVIVVTISGPLRSLLTAERTALNFLTHLSGIATLTRRFVDAIAGTDAAILDTRKTLPGWRTLEKYAVRLGGGTNHRIGLYDGILIKDNHLAAWSRAQPSATIADAVRAARQTATDDQNTIPIEVEVDTLDQLVDALDGLPDIVLLDNMNVEMLREAVAIRNRTAPDVQLEASGGITLDHVAAVAQTGVERISVGAITHSAPAVDLALDWTTSFDDM